MNETKIKVPEDMHEAVRKALEKGFFEGVLNPSGAFGEEAYRKHSHVAAEAALLWQRENPILPTDEQLYSTIGKLPVAMCDIVWTERDRAMIAEWVRRMYDAPETQLGFSDLMWDNDNAKHLAGSTVLHNEQIIETWNRAKKLYSEKE